MRTKSLRTVSSSGAPHYSTVLTVTNHYAPESGLRLPGDQRGGGPGGGDR